MPLGYVIVRVFEEFLAAWVEGKSVAFSESFEDVGGDPVDFGCFTKGEFGECVD